jgi:acyl-CoA reductase-like NAD-dependent aldehyde dehydrogenase
VWKPAPAAARISVRLLALAGEAGLPAGVVNLVSGGHRAARTLLSEEGIDAISLSGSAAAGWAAQEIAARRRVPFQAELGGNNAAIVAESADVSEAAGAIARGAFSFAGQRCTANRRAVVDDRIHDAFLEAVAAATASLVWGDPLDPVTEVGPVVSRESKERIATAIERARAGGARITAPHASLPHGHAHGAYAPPAIVDGAPAASEIVQEETFGPVLVVQRARGFENALELAHGVRQGLVSALFSRDASERETFLARARAGLLKINRPTTGTDAFAPFGGWRASGVGPPERGPGDVEFYTRVQTLSGEI